uniref:Uncharacterized protein n=1 Tax=Nothobranchius rachovii TaxID=451742 RepID=A0A1A8P7L4_9TELE
MPTLLVYDRLSLLDLRPSAKSWAKWNQAGHKTLPPLISEIPAHLCRVPDPPLRHKCRRRGRRAGFLVKLKASLGYSHKPLFRKQGAVPNLRFSRRSLDPVCAWLVPVFGLDGTPQSRKPCSPRPRRRGVNPRILQPLCRASRMASDGDPPLTARFGLICQIPDLLCSQAEEPSSWFDSTCRTALDTVAPLKTRLPKTKSEPWLNDMTRVVRRDCRRAERKWKKDKLQVSFQMLKDCWRQYQRTVKEAKRKHLSDIILSNCHSPRVLFKTINSVLSAPYADCIEPSLEACENLLLFFIEKVSSTRAQICPCAHDPSVVVSCSAVFDRFEPVTLSCLQETVGHLKPAGSPNDAVPPRLLIEVLPTVGPLVLELVNHSLMSGVDPKDFKHATCS